MPAAATTPVLLERVLSQPTAPFREYWVRSALAQILTENSIPHFTDPTGNLIAGAKSMTDLGKHFRVVMMAHMDHPGFHLDSQIDGSLWRCRWYGGAPFQKMPGAKVRVFDPSTPGRSAQGTVVKFEKDGAPDTEEGLAFLVEFEHDLSGFAEGSFGAFDFKGCEIDGDLIHCSGADDVAGCVIALGALLDQEAELASKSRSRPQSQTQSKKTRRLAAIFTRAEEVGFIGCLDLLMRKSLPKNLWFLSLEASRALPEAELGRGAVLRLGDKRTLFDAGFTAILGQTAEKLKLDAAGTTKPFQYQRRLMNGGTCEGTPLTVFGYKVAAIAVPLENYHNTGPDGPAPERISLSDVEGARRLCTTLGRALEKQPAWEKQTLKEIVSDYNQLKPLLKTRVKFAEK